MDKQASPAAWLQGERDAALQRAQALRADGRTDEAVMEQVRANIYDIFLTVSRKAADVAPGDPMGFLRDRVQAIPAAWNEALAAAQAHGDDAKAQTEQVKLHTAAEISAMLARMAQGGE